MNGKNYLVLSILLIAILLFIYIPNGNNNKPEETKLGEIVSESPASLEDVKFVLPIEGALSRVTKKPFGIYITPKNSPITPEKFTGYHSGVDLEILPNEKDKDVAVYVICSGKIILKRWATGYGGVVVESCEWQGKDITVVYGHLDVDSVKTTLGGNISAGDMLGFLGKGESSETDNERKHLHLGIHLGKDINIKGYVQSKEELNSWIDPALILPIQ